MKKLILVAFLAVGCSSTSGHKNNSVSSFESASTTFLEKSLGREAEVVTIDSCEYIMWGGAQATVNLTHKGNCKWCLKRNKWFG